MRPERTTLPGPPPWNGRPAIGEAAIGRAVRVYRKEEHDWFTATVAAYDSTRTERRRALICAARKVQFCAAVVETKYGSRPKGVLSRFVFDIDDVLSKHTPQSPHTRGICV